MFQEKKEHLSPSFFFQTIYALRPNPVPHGRNVVMEYSYGCWCRVQHACRSKGPINQSIECLHVTALHMHGRFEMPDWLLSIFSCLDSSSPSSLLSLMWNSYDDLGFFSNYIGRHFWENHVKFLQTLRPLSASIRSFYTAEQIIWSMIFFFFAQKSRAEINTSSLLRLAHEWLARPIAFVIAREWHKIDRSRLTTRNPDTGL